MRNRIGTFLTAVAVVWQLGIVLGQSSVPCPPHCDPKNLEAEYGDGWHVMYFLLGCWQLPESCNYTEAVAEGVPTAALAPRRLTIANLRVHGQ